jgi:hypothetical protein
VRDSIGHADAQRHLVKGLGLAHGALGPLETQPMLPMGFGYVEGVTHDYKRHGTTTLFAALNVLNGAVLASCKPARLQAPRHDHAVCSPERAQRRRAGELQASP